MSVEKVARVGGEPAYVLLAQMEERLGVLEEMVASRDDRIAKLENTPHKRLKGFGRRTIASAASAVANAFVVAFTASSAFATSSASRAWARLRG